MSVFYERERMNFDVIIVGAGPAGLSAAIRLGQWNQKASAPLSVCVIDKGALVGAHILSGAVLEPSALNLLIPDWKNKNAPLQTAVCEDQFLLLTKKNHWRLPVPLVMKNDGNYIISLELFCQWLAEQAEALGIAIFPGFAATNLLFDDENQVIGVQTGDKGLNAEGRPTAVFQPGIELYAKQTILAEGCRGSLTEKVLHHYHLREKCEPQSYGLGIKEIWEVDSPEYRPGRVVHTVGWPLDRQTYGGSFVYHLDQQRVAIGLIMGLDYQNPYLDPFQELQRLKTHPYFCDLLRKGRCISYGARSLNEGGWQAIPKLTFPGGLIVGCGAGFLNVGKIKGTHTAMLSGILAADTLTDAFTKQGDSELFSYEQKIRQSSIATELYQVRNLRPGFHYGLWMGLCHAALDQYIFRGQAPWTLHYRHPDHSMLKSAQKSVKITYPKPDGKLTFDKLTQVYLSGTQHREPQPCHLILKDTSIPIDINLMQFDSPEQRYCPAAVYEIVMHLGQKKLQINAANCLHCKACDIKDPLQNIIWTPPEGGDGPNYVAM